MNGRHRAKKVSDIDPLSIGESDLPPRTAMAGTIMTEYLVVPDLYRFAVNPDRDLWTVRVRRADMLDDLWMVTSHCGQYAWTEHNQMVQLNRVHRRLVNLWCRMPLRDAHRIARRAVDAIKVNGLTLAEANATAEAHGQVTRLRGEAMDRERGAFLAKAG